MPRLNTRLITLEKRPPTKRPPVMSQHALAPHLGSMDLRKVEAFVNTMIDDDLQISIDFLTSVIYSQEQRHEHT